MELLSSAVEFAGDVMATSVESLQISLAVLVPTFGFVWHLSEKLLGRIKRLENEVSELRHYVSLAETSCKYENTSLKVEVHDAEADIDKLYRHIDRNKRAIADITAWLSVRGFIPRSKGWPTSDPPTAGYPQRREPISDIPRESEE